MNIVASPAKQNKTKQKFDHSKIVIEGTLAEKEANQIMAVCRHFSNREMENLSCLYLGAVDSVKTECLAHNFKEVIALDTDESVLKMNRRLSDQDNIKYICCKDGNLSIDDLTIDVVICDRFYSRVDNPEELLYEIYRVLKYDGFCYFSAYNKMSLIERHFSIPFLSWVPGWVAEILMKLSGRKGKYNYKLLRLSKLRKLINNFWRHDYVGLIRQNPLVFQAQDNLSPNQSKPISSWRVLKYIYPFLPLWTWVLTKKK
ncbi:MAG: class I SAM-dependent methyltransferase [candidate division Zixibacteria bacterium]|nr:class I SAM-dependent methyltransferase [candidate division Zixibacteria bacterium]